MKIKTIEQARELGLWTFLYPNGEWEYMDTKGEWHTVKGEENE